MGLCRSPDQDSYDRVGEPWGDIHPSQVNTPTKPVAVTFQTCIAHCEVLYLSVRPGLSSWLFISQPTTVLLMIRRDLEMHYKTGLPEFRSWILR
jgi:hypothetical protein